MADVLQFKKEGFYMRIANGVEMLEISAMMVGRANVVNPTLIWDEESVILIDTGFPGQLQLIQEAILNAGIPWDKLNKIIITHQDIDHIGSLPSILNESTQSIEVLANELEKPYIEGQKQLLRMTPEAIAKAEANLPESMSNEQREAFVNRLKNPPHAPVDQILADGEELSYCGGITVINTPGHTPGHISLYHKPSRTLIAADAMIVEAGQLLGPVPAHALDYDLAVRSLSKYITYDIDNVICFHGGLFNNNPNQRISELVTLHQSQ
jgi:glyoxylase-like metal-dependent hydrolase (beta-lactamase superfamily II)